MQEFLRQYGIYLVFIMGMIFFALRMFRTKRFVPENISIHRKKANILIRDWFTRVARLDKKDKLTEDDIAEIYVLQTKTDEFVENHKKIALYFDEEAIAEIFEKLNIAKKPELEEFMKIAGLDDAVTVSNYYREKIDKWIEGIDFPPFFPLELYWEIIKGHYYVYHEHKMYRDEPGLKEKLENIRRLVKIVDIQLDYADNEE